MTRVQESSRPAITAWVVCGVSTVVALGRLGLAIVDPASSDASSAPGVPGGGTPVAAFEALTLTAIAIIGAVVASRQPRNPVGWILSAIALFLGVLILSSHTFWALTLGQSEVSDAATWAAWLASWIWVPAMIPALTLFPLYFPNGRLPTPRWRWVLWAAVVAIPASFISQAFVRGDFAEYPVTNPVGADGVLGSVVEVIGTLSFALMLVAILGSGASLVVRFRRSQDEERQQIKWVATAALLQVVIFFTPLDDVFGEDVGFASLLLGLLVVAGAVAISILRYRLYDIDLVISKTLLVAGLAGFITATYVAIVVGVGSLVGRGDEPNLVLSVAATALVAVAFQPVRRRLRRLANRLVFGRRATPYDVLSGFATRVGAAEASPETLVGLAELMVDGTGAQPARVWLRVGSELRPAATWPVQKNSIDRIETVDADATSDLPDADLAVPVHDQNELLGVLTIAKPRGEQVTEVDTDLVERLAAASGVLLRNLRLDAELAQRLDDIEASRRRLVTSQDDARRQIEADLAGGSRAQLIALRERLSELAPDVDSERAPKTAVLVGQLTSATEGALQTLDGLASGVYPPRLAADGLVTALSEQAAKSAIRVDVDAAGVGRFPAEVELAVYFSVLEALQNVAKYADADSARVRLAHEGDRLTFEVTDDGIGFDTGTVSKGTGLQGIVDRLDTVAGGLTITSEPGTGTTVAGYVPVTATSHRTLVTPASSPVGVSR